MVGRKITCYTPLFPPFRAIEFSFAEVRLQVNGKSDRLSIIICVPEGNSISINPHEINLLSEKKVLLETLEFYTISWAYSIMDSAVGFGSEKRGDTD